MRLWSVQCTKEKLNNIKPHEIIEFFFSNLLASQNQFRLMYEYRYNKYLTELNDDWNQGGGFIYQFFKFDDSVKPIKKILHHGH